MGQGKHINVYELRKTRNPAKRDYSVWSQVLKPHLDLRIRR